MDDVNVAAYWQGVVRDLTAERDQLKAEVARLRAIEQRALEVARGEGDLLYLGRAEAVDYILGRA